MKTIAHLKNCLINLCLILCFGCASVRAEPLPTNSVPSALAWNPSSSAAYYRPYYLTNGVDAAGVGQSTRWTPLPDTTGTNADISRLPAGSLMLVASANADSTVWALSEIITNTPAVTAATNLKVKK